MGRRKQAAAAARAQAERNRTTSARRSSDLDKPEKVEKLKAQLEKTHQQFLESSRRSISEAEKLELKKESLMVALRRVKHKQLTMEQENYSLNENVKYGGSGMKNLENMKQEAVTLKASIAAMSEEHTHLENMIKTKESDLQTFPEREQHLVQEKKEIEARLDKFIRTNRELCQKIRKEIEVQAKKTAESEAKAHEIQEELVTISAEVSQQQDEKSGYEMTMKEEINKYEDDIAKNKSVHTALMTKLDAIHKEEQNLLDVYLKETDKVLSETERFKAQCKAHEEVIVRRLQEELESLQAMRVKPKKILSKAGKKGIESEKAQILLAKIETEILESLYTPTEEFYAQDREGRKQDFRTTEREMENSQVVLQEEQRKLDSAVQNDPTLEEKADLLEDLQVLQRTIAEFDEKNNMDQNVETVESLERKIAAIRMELRGLEDQRERRREQEEEAEMYDDSSPSSSMSPSPDSMSRSRNDSEVSTDSRKSRGRTFLNMHSQFAPGDEELMRRGSATSVSSRKTVTFVDE